MFEIVDSCLFVEEFKRFLIGEGVKWYREWMFEKDGGGVEFVKEDGSVWRCGNDGPYELVKV